VRELEAALEGLGLSTPSIDLAKTEAR
jgi:hypothetical protein